MDGAQHNKNEDSRLLDSAAKGDAEAIREIVERHKTMVYGTCLRILGNEADAARPRLCGPRNAGQLASTASGGGT